jgi:hypothetical protein
MDVGEKLIHHKMEFLSKESLDYETEYDELSQTGGACFERIKANFLRNVSKMSRRRLTTDLEGKPLGASITPMHKNNIKRLKNAYRHPF